MSINRAQAISVLLLAAWLIHVHAADRSMEDNPELRQKPVLDGEMVWLCGLERGESHVLRCVERPSPGAQARDVSARKPLDSQKFLAELFMPGAPRNITRLVRDNPAIYGGHVWNIPLFSAPIDMKQARLLATSVMCGREAACTVEFRDR